MECPNKALEPEKMSTDVPMLFMEAKICFFNTIIQKFTTGDIFSNIHMLTLLNFLNSENIFVDKTIWPFLPEISFVVGTQQSPCHFSVESYQIVSSY